MITITINFDNKNKESQKKNIDIRDILINFPKYEKW